VNNVSYRLSFSAFLSRAGIPGFILLIRPVIMALISRKRSVLEVSSVDASASVQMLLAFVAFGVALFYFQKVKTFRKLILHTPLIWFYLFTLWAAITSLWSVNSLLSAYRAFETLSWAMLIGALLSRLSERMTIIEIITWVLYYAVFDIVVNVLINSLRFNYPIFSFETLLIEQLRSTPYFFLALLLPIGWLVKLIILPISIFSLSNTAYVGMAGGLIPMMTNKGKWRRIFLLITLITLIAFVLFGTQRVLQSTIFYGQKGIGLEYTTGRDKITEVVLQKSMEKPLLGHGFVASEIQLMKTRNGLISVHNGFLSALYGTGFIGLLLFSVFFVKTTFAAGSKYLPPELRNAFLSSVILITIHTLGNPGLGTRVYGTWIPSVLIFTMICLVQQHYKQQFLDENDLVDTE
jgi:O-antigen ligase